MSEVDVTQISDRLARALGVYCLEMDENLIDDLRIAVTEGSFDWFPAEFEDAVRSKAFTPQSWEKLTGVLMDADDDELLDDYLQLVWAAVIPSRPYPHSGQ